MPTVTAIFPYSPECTVNSCLEQVAGLLDSPLEVYYGACTSAFGVPITTTQTVDSVVHTTTETITYTDVYVTLTDATVTVTDAATETSTIVVTTTTVVTPGIEAPPVITGSLTTVSPDVVKKKRDGMDKDRYSRKKRRACTSRSSVTSSMAVSVPTHCADVVEFSSACSCITAVAQTSTVTVWDPTTTGTITVTETSSTTLAPSTVTSTVTSTRTITETAAPSPTAITDFWIFESPEGLQGTPIGYLENQDSWYFFDLSPYPDLEWKPISIPIGGGQPFAANDSTVKLYVTTFHPQQNLLKWRAPQQVQPGEVPVECSVGGDNRIRCIAPEHPIDDKLRLCGSHLFLSNLEWLPSDCQDVAFFVAGLPPIQDPPSTSATTAAAPTETTTQTVSSTATPSPTTEINFNASPWRFSEPEFLSETTIGFHEDSYFFSNAWPSDSSIAIPEGGGQPWLMEYPEIKLFTVELEEEGAALWWQRPQDIGPWAHPVHCHIEGFWDVACVVDGVPEFNRFQLCGDVLHIVGIGWERDNCYNARLHVGEMK
ncbi:hypothetical protein VTJ49DRAFT_2430 [Mycothermus thermophilus]|uniref:Uncharacterized protein n=1 Tax=Humicola insolens TaxID=85995 RepID=A0ABR3VB93_HUMIN